jgi:hypothetical protein
LGLEWELWLGQRAEKEKVKRVRVKESKKGEDKGKITNGSKN